MAKRNRSNNDPQNTTQKTLGDYCAPSKVENLSYIVVNK